MKEIDHAAAAIPRYRAGDVRGAAPTGRHQYQFLTVELRRGQQHI